MDERVDNLGRQLQSLGHRLTAARQTILETLVASNGHLSADELATAARSREPSLGRMTVYRTLDLLCGLGLIRPVYQGSAAARYVLLEGGHHHHFVCSGCDQVIEFDECVIHDLERLLGGRLELEIQGHLLELYGLCPDCRE